MTSEHHRLGAGQNGKPRPLTSFFTKGQKFTHKTSYIYINQCYVQYMRPSSRPSKHDSEHDLLPILFLHGGGLTGAQWEATPDRRPGWAVLASEQHYHVYILDGVDSGRSQAALTAAREGPVEHRTCEEVWTRFRFGSTSDFEDRKAFKRSQVAIESIDALVASQAARRRTTDDVEMGGIVDAVREIGNIVIAHSHGAALVMDALDELKPYIAKLVLVEPGETAKSARLLPDIPTLLLWGDFLTEHLVWAKILKSYNNAPVNTLWVPEHGIAGNTHFPMPDRNSDIVFKNILEWLQA